MELSLASSSSFTLACLVHELVENGALDINDLTDSRVNVALHVEEEEEEEEMVGSSSSPRPYCNELNLLIIFFFFLLLLLSPRKSNPQRGG